MKTLLKFWRCFHAFVTAVGIGIAALCAYHVVVGHEVDEVFMFVLASGVSWIVLHDNWIATERWLDSLPQKDDE